MIIKRMKASFGNLESREITFEDGLNIITAPNESGKSTWCAFIRAMLYGIDSSERARAGHRPDKQRFAPWSGAPMEGEMDIVHGGREITLTRTGRANAPMREFHAHYTGTANPVPGLTGETAGESLFGVPRAVFERSAFVRQSGVGVSSSPELNSKIAAIVTSAEEDTPFEEADARLRAWQRRRKFRNSGELPDLEADIETREHRLADIGGSAERRAELEADFQRAEARCADVRQRLETFRRERRQAALAGMAAAQKELNTREAELSDARVYAASRHAELQHGVFGDAPPEDVEADVRRDCGHAEELLRTANARPNVVLPIVLALLCLGAAVAGFILMNFILFAAAGLLLTGAVVSIVLHVKKNRAAANAGLELQTLLARYSAGDPRGIMDALTIHIEHWNEYDDALDLLRSAESAAEAAARGQKELQNEILSDLNFQAGSTAGALLTAELASAEESVRERRDALSAAGGRISALGDPMALRSELTSLEARLLEKNREYNAISAAIEALSEANEAIQSRFSPALSRRAGEIFSRITGGENEEVRFDRELEAMVRREGEALPHDSLFLSEGARNALYLALRLAICELAMPENELCPLILDDALVTLDDERMRRAIDFLREVAENRQVILFSCHGREASYLEGPSL